MFKTKEELQDFISGGVYRCDFADHDFLCDKRDTEAIKKHEELEHTISGHAPCQRCGKIVEFKGLPKPAEGQTPGAFCDKCKEQLRKELFPNE